MDLTYPSAGSTTLRRLVPRVMTKLVQRYTALPEANPSTLRRVVVPVGFHEERHASCSYEDAIGAIYLTLHPSPLKLAEAVVHEYPHNKLHAVMRLDPILQNERTHAKPTKLVRALFD